MAIASTAATSDQAARDATRPLGGRLGARGEIGRRGLLEPVAERVELWVELGHRDISTESEKCLRRALRPRETRARTAWGEVASCSAASS